MTAEERKVYVKKSFLHAVKFVKDSIGITLAESLDLVKKDRDY